MLLLLRDIPCLDHHQRQGQDGIVVTRFAAHEHAIAHLYVCLGHGNGILEVFLAGSHTLYADAILQGDIHVRTGIRF